MSVQAMAEAGAMLQVAALNAAYAAALDGDRLEQWPDFFVDDCIYKITSAGNVREGLEAGIVYADSRAMLVDRVVSLRRANVYERHSYRHVVGLPIVRDAGGLLLAEASFVVVRTMRDGRMDLFVAGRYQDRIEATDGALRFRERVVVCDSSRFDTLVALPL